MTSIEIIVSDIRDSILEISKNYREKKEMAIADFNTTDISISNFENDCYIIMNNLMFSFRAAPEVISFEDSYCIFEYEELFFWIGFTVEDEDVTNINIFFETDVSDFKFSRPYAKISDRCDGWAEDGLFSWLNDI